MVVACSGGADSLALLAATVFELRTAPVRVVGAVVDHGAPGRQRGPHGPRGGADGCARCRRDRQRPGRRRAGRAGDRGGRPGGPLRRARAGRRAVRCRTGAARAHPRRPGRDRAPRAHPRLGRVARSPACARRTASSCVRSSDIRRAQTEAACEAEGIEFWTDPHNADPRFTRSRVRHTVLPLLERELGPGVAETLARTAEQLRPDMEALDELAAATLRETYDDENGFDVWRIEVLHSRRPHPDAPSRRPPRRLPARRALRRPRRRPGGPGVEPSPPARAGSSCPATSPPSARATTCASEPPTP